MEHIGIYAMKLSVADVDKMIADSIPRARGQVSADDFDGQSRSRQLELIEGFAQMQSQATARIGEILPPPPKSLKSEVDSANDFGIDPDSTSGAPVTPAVREAPIPRALAGVDLDTICSRATLIFALTQNLPANELGLPKLLYSPDVLDWTLFAGRISTDKTNEDRYLAMQSYLDAATLHLSYVEGFPSLTTGTPLWARLPFESVDAYQAFAQYCELPGARQTHKITAWPPENVLDWYHTNYWGIRAKCYDMLRNIHASKIREQRILSCEDNHFLEADRLLSKMKSMMADVDWDQLKSDPKAFVEVMEKAVKLQRMALNIAATDKARNEIKVESVEVQMKKLAVGGEDIKMTDEGASIREILKNPGALASAQELIIRMTKTSQALPVTPEE